MWRASLSRGLQAATNGRSRTRWGGRTDPLRLSSGRRELERKDGILLNLTERIPQLEAPSEARGSLETAEEQQGRGGGAHSDAPGAPEAVQRRSWWRRILGG